ncbi:prolyl 4-hydroxylase [Cotonvirus japonicus]|uniref:Prolyl 4-hydroxylase n=1 Tax=Cotonvirus japonicus TaxID=2811091 RepID=A0ABM7NTA1_9VIRU|nr:prolyl 4-hydroxylase [Cotonvirus japonicus]BCS83404.1 prolyl 4-hydroxylase [Cotonvirus japonicus]
MSIVIAMIIIAIIIMLIKNQSKKISPFTNLNESLSYANNNDPYDMPFIMKEIISKDKCQEIINYSKDKLFDSQVLSGKDTSVRNSQQYWIPKNNNIVKPIFDFVSKNFNIPVENAEDLQVVRYLPNQYYNEHHDSCCDQTDKCHEFINRGGQRILTVLIYLNNEFEGGNTYFKNLDVKIKPKTGDALVFFPLAKNTNKCHPLALHAGMPVTSGQKWIANIWFRERKFKN